MPKRRLDENGIEICKNGHRVTGDNLRVAITYKGRLGTDKKYKSVEKICRACAREFNRRIRQQKVLDKVGFKKA